jgi:hypothetical protein
MYWQYTTAFAATVVSVTIPTIRKAYNDIAIFISWSPSTWSIAKALTAAKRSMWSARARFVVPRFYFAGGSFSFSITSFRLKLAAFCRCGYSLNDVRNSPT